MKNDKLPASVLSVKVVSNVDNGLFKQLDLNRIKEALVLLHLIVMM